MSQSRSPSPVEEGIPPSLVKSQEFSIKPNESSQSLLEGLNNSSEGTPLPYQRLSNDPSPTPVIAAKAKPGNELPAPEPVRIQVKTVVTVSPGLKPKIATQTFTEVDLNAPPSLPTIPSTGQLQIQRTPVRTPKTPKAKKRLRDEKAGACTKVKMCLSDYSFELFLLLGIASALPTALYALMGASNKQPNDLGSQWWDEMNDFLRALSVISCGSSLAINSLMNEILLNKVSSNLRKLENHRIKFLISLLLSSAGTVASGKIAWDGSPSWAGTGGAIFNMLANGFTTLITRSVGGAVIATEKLEGLCKRTERRNQMELIEALKDFDPAFKQEIEEFIIEKVNDSLSDDGTALTVLKHITDKIIENNGRYANETSWGTSFQKWGSRLFAATMATIVFPVFAQKGYNGITAFSPLDPKDDYYISKGIGIGFIPGLASSLFYYISCRDTIPTMINAVRYLRRHKQEIPLFILWLAANAAASMSMFNIAQGVQDKPNGIFPFLKDLPPLLFPILNAIAGGFVNGTFIIRRQFSYNGLDFNFNDFIRHCEQNVLPSYQSSVGTHVSGVAHALDTIKEYKADGNSKKQTNRYALFKDVSTKEPLLGNDTKENEVLLQDPPEAIFYQVEDVRKSSPSLV